MISLYLFAFLLHTCSGLQHLNDTVAKTWLDHGRAAPSARTKEVVKEKLLLHAAANPVGLVNLIDIKFMTKIRKKFYDNMPAGKSKNFQFAVFKFGPSNSDWYPSIDHAGLVWSGSQLVVDEADNNWQASAYDSCDGGCHTEAAIIDETDTNGFQAMLGRECEEMAPHILNIYSFNSPCIITAGCGCQELIQRTLVSFFSEGYDNCNKENWEIYIVWSVQFRDQTAVECLGSWESFQDDMENVPNLTLKYGRQPIGPITE